MNILITGTSKGIGKFLSETLLKEGHFVFGCSRSKSTIHHDRYKHYEVDLEIDHQIIEMIRSIKHDYHFIDVLINNAAVNPIISPAALVSNTAINQVFKINVFAVMILCREVIKVMQKRKFGRIINIGSMAAKLEVEGEALYTSAKAAINSYSRVLAKEVYGMGITVNVLAPSAIPTELSEKINQEALRNVLERNAIKIYGEMGDVTNAISFLINTNSKAITGQIIYLGGV